MKPELPFGYDYCPDCKETKEIHLFPNSGSYCRKCLSIRTRNAPNYKENVRKAQLKKKYGITPERYDEMEAEQNGLCAICYQTERQKNKEKLSVDHDHETNAVRGLLCHSCNLAIGQFEDNIERLESAIEYLKKHLK